jgi:endonuclease/exonuclease/phosphatase family metal-dependent hydrolase
MQEALKHQLEELKTLLPGFEYHGVGRDDGISKGEHSAIFIRTERFRVLAKGDFWLSETPGKPGYGWDARINRICSWVKLVDQRSGREFFVFNAHYDHQGVKARIESSKLIEKKIMEIAGQAHVIFMGDLNGNHQSEWYRHIAASELKDALLQAPDPYIPSGSFNGFRKDGIQKDVIDHIFVSKGFQVSKAGILTDTYDGKFPSDHFPVMAVITL